MSGVEVAPQLTGKEGRWVGGLVPGPLTTVPGAGTPPPSGLTSIPGEVEAEDVGAVGTEVGQPPQVGLQRPTGQLRLEQQCQVAEDKGIQGGRAAAEREGRDGVALGRQGRRGHRLDLVWGAA